MSLPWKARISSMQCLGRAVESHVHFSAPLFYRPSWFFGFTWGTALKPSKSGSSSANFQLGFYFRLCELVRWAFSTGLQQPLALARCQSLLCFFFSIQVFKVVEMGAMPVHFLPGLHVLLSTEADSSWFPSWAHRPTSPSTQVTFHLQVHLASSCIASVTHSPMFWETETSLRFSVLLRI